jgi:uracil-DNA glycosylase
MRVEERASRRDPAQKNAQALPPFVNSDEPLVDDRNVVFVGRSAARSARPATGECLESPELSVRAHEVRIDDGRVLVAAS